MTAEEWERDDADEPSQWKLIVSRTITSVVGRKVSPHVTIAAISALARLPAAFWLARDLFEPSELRQFLKGLESIAVDPNPDMKQAKLAVRRCYALGIASTHLRRDFLGSSMTAGVLPPAWEYLSNNLEASAADPVATRARFEQNAFATGIAKLIQVRSPWAGMLLRLMANTCSLHASTC